MPIRINLLAEQFSAEAARRCDPVKRAMWIAGFIVSLMLLGGGYLQTRIFLAGRSYGAEKAKLKNLEKGSSAAAKNLNRTKEIETRLGAVNAFATNRFLWASTLNALQYVLVDNISVVKIKGDQDFGIEQVKPTKKELDAGVAKGVAPKTREMARERITLTVEARDYADPADLNYNQFISRLAGAELFQRELEGTEGITLKDRLPRQSLPNNPGRQFIPFSIECRFPERKRQL
jgi:hypothetical protein